MIARLEQDDRAVTLHVAYVCALLFGVEPSEIFPTLFVNIEERVAGRVNELMERICEAESTKSTALKLELLRGVLSRIGPGSQQEI